LALLAVLLVRTIHASLRQ